MEHLEYLLTHEGLKPLTESNGDLALQYPTNVKQLQKMLSLVEYDQDI